MVEQQQMADSKVSSTIIRQALSRGRVDKASKLLTHPYIIICELSADGVVKNLDPHKLLPTAGVYDATIDGKGVELQINDDRTIKVAPTATKGKVIIEIE